MNRNIIIAIVFILGLTTQLFPSYGYAISETDKHHINYDTSFLSLDSCSEEFDSADNVEGLTKKVPEPYKTIFNQAGERYGVEPALIAALFYDGENGRKWPKDTENWPTNPLYDASGPFQFLPGTWGAGYRKGAPWGSGTGYGVDADGNGKKEVDNLKDAAYAAANYAKANGAVKGESEEKIRTFISQYGGESPPGEYTSRVYSGYQRFITFQGTNEPEPELNEGGSEVQATNCDNTIEGDDRCDTLKTPTINDGAALAEVIDKYIKDAAPTSPMKNHGKYFVEGASSGVNPLAMVVIARYEANFLTNPNAVDMINGNNPFAYSQYGNWPASGRWAKFPDIKTAIVEVMKQMKPDYLEGGVNKGKPLIKMEDVMSVYAPEFENDTAKYTSTIKEWLQELKEKAGSSVDCGVGEAKIIQKKPYSRHTGGKMSNKPTAIVLHWWGGRSNGQGINFLTSVLNDRRLSVQLGITADGKTYQLTRTLDTVAYHATCVNSYAIGIEIEGLPSDFGAGGPADNPEKFNAVVATVKYLQDKYNIPTEAVYSSSKVKGVTTHRDVDDKLCGGTKPDVDKDYYRKVLEAL